MGLGKLRPIVVAVVIMVVVGIVVALSPSVGTATILGNGDATNGQTSTVGALFMLTPSGKLNNHFCTASVVDSPAGDLVITAAHCVTGRPANEVAFVPDYSHGQEPFGVWTVSQVIMDQQWQSSADPDDDFAFLIVHQTASKVPVEELTGGEAIGIGVSSARTVKVAGYPDTEDGMITCENPAQAFSPTQLQFDCDGFTDGTSGSPLIAYSGPFDNVDTVIGVIGGYQQGGFTASVSYAAKFGTQMTALYQTAIAAAKG
jgi:V8-like Glu-specific endopeptidase